MSMQRTLSWNTALRGLNADRIALTPEARRAITARAVHVKLAAENAKHAARTAPFVVAGRYDRRAIMAAAIRSAQIRRQVTGEAWGVCLSAALKGTWQVAKAARLARAH